MCTVKLIQNKIRCKTKNGIYGTVKIAHTFLPLVAVIKKIILFSRVLSRSIKNQIMLLLCKLQNRQLLYLLIRLDGVKE